MKLTYTIMPDFAWAYGWLTRGDPESRTGVGSCWRIDNLRELGFHVTDKLERDFESWQETFEIAPFNGFVDLDWPHYHARGIDLARRLKAELGDGVRIIYEKPCEDRNRLQRERREVLADGSVMDQPSREEINCAADQQLAERVALRKAMPPLSESEWCDQFIRLFPQSPRMDGA